MRNLISLTLTLIVLLSFLAINADLPKFITGFAASTESFRTHAGSVSQFSVTATDGGSIQTQTSGTSFNVKITALDSSNNVATDFDSAGNTVEVSSTCTLSSGSGTTGTFTNGVLSPHSITISNTGTCKISVTDSAGGSGSGTETGESNSFTVNSPTVPQVCGDLNTANIIYTMTRDVNSSGSCFSIQADNVTLDCAGYLINFSQSFSGSGVSIGIGVKNSTTIKNCNIIQENSSVDDGAVYGFNVLDANFTDGLFIINNSVNISAINSYGIRFNTIGSNYTLIENNTITIFNSSIGMDFSSAANLSALRNNIVVNGSSTGISLSSLNSSIISRNIITSYKGSTGVSGSMFFVNLTGNIITTLDNGGIGINVKTSSNNLLISGNNLSADGIFGHGISFDSGIQIEVISNNISTYGNSSNGLSLTTTNGVMIENNTIATNNHGANGIFGSASTLITIFNNTITTAGAQSRGIQFNTGGGASSSGNVITYNNITTTGSPVTGFTRSSHGVLFFSGGTGSRANNNTISNNTITTSGTGANGILFIPSSATGQNRNNMSSNILESNNIITTGSGIGFDVGFSNNNILTENNISFNSITVHEDAASGIFFAAGSGSGNSVTNNSLWNNQITVNGTGARSVFINSSSGNNFTNNIISSLSSYILATGTSLNNTLTNNTFSSGNGSIRHYDLVLLPSNADVNTQRLNITFNRTFLNSSDGNASFLNVSSGITLKGLAFANPQPLLDLDDDGVFEICPGSVCKEVSYEDGTFIFNVTRFTTYSSNESNVITFSNFIGDSTNLSRGDLANIGDLTLHNPSHGKIIWLGSTDLSNGADLDLNVNISFNRIEINSTALSSLNKSAQIQLFNLTFANPQILVDGSVCPSSQCVQINYTGTTLKTLTFNVTHFTVYGSRETPSTASTGGGGSGSSSCPSAATYSCREWSECSEGGKQIRVCKDNVCGQPDRTEERSCKMAVPAPEIEEEAVSEAVEEKAEEKIEEKEVKAFKGKTEVIIIAAVIIAVLFIVLMRPLKSKRPKKDKKRR